MGGALRPASFRLRDIVRTVACACAALTSACSSLGEQASDIIFIPHRNSAKIDDAATLALFFEYKEKEKEDELAAESMRAAFPGAVAVLGPALIGLALDGIEQGLADESGRYVASYSAGRTVRTTKEAARAKPLAGFLFERRVEGGEDKDGGKNYIEGMRFCAAIDMIDEANGLFVIRPYAIEMFRSKAKVVAFDMTSPFGFDLLNPWEVVTDWIDHPPRFPADDAIDVAVEVELTSLAYDKAGNVAKTVSHGKRAFAFKDVPLGAPKSGDPSTCKDYRPVKPEPLDDTKQLQLGSLMAMPRPTSAESDLIVYNVVVTATETDEFGKRVKVVSDRFKKERPGLEGTLTDILPK